MKKSLTTKITMGLASIVLLSGFSLSVSAATVIDGNLSQTDANQLEDWLGQGSIDLTNIWSGTAGATSASWHSAVDGAGPTFSIYDVTSGENNYLVGGYTEADWSSVNNYKFDSNAFVFNLTTGEKQSVRTGQYAIQAHADRFAAFGLDLFRAGDIHGGRSVLDSAVRQIAKVTGTYNSSNNIVTGSGSMRSYYINSLETYTVTSAVPEPSVIAMMGLGLGLVGFMSLRRRKSEATA